MTSRRAALALICGVVAVACGNLIGIPDRELAGSDGGADATDGGPDAAGGGARDAAHPGRSGLSALSTSLGTLSPAFSPTRFDYAVKVSDSFGIDPFTVTATAASPDARLAIAGKPATSGAASPPFALSLTGPTPIDVAVTSGPGTQDYRIAVTSAPEYTYVKPSSTRAGGLFGSSVATSGDTLVVGAIGEASGGTGIDGGPGDAGATLAGAVYVFTRSGNAWSQQARLEASNSRAGSWFGRSVAIEGDTLVVGAIGESSSAAGVDGDQSDTSASFAGAVYVFTRSGSTWTQQAYLKASNARANSYFGSGLAIASGTIAVGAEGESSLATGVNGDQGDAAAQGAGAVYVFTRSLARTWTQQAYLKPSNAPFDPRTHTYYGCAFGHSVAMDGDTLAVGAYGESSSATGIDGNQGDWSAPSAGAVYVFTRSGETWAQQAYVKASNRGGEFGNSVALQGDTLAVGADYEASSATGVDGDQSDSSAPYAGAVYVFARSGATWAQQAYVKPSNTHAGSQFGSSLALSGDRLGVGSVFEASGATGIDGDASDRSAGYAGATYMFARAGTVWTQEAYVKASSTRPDSHFGVGVAIAGDALAIGAEGESSGATGIDGDQSDTSAERAGAVYVVR